MQSRGDVNALQLEYGVNPLSILTLDWSGPLGSDRLIEII